jgi:flagellar basal-body rod protein FlgG
MGVQDVSVTKIFEQGALQDTGDPYNLAIKGPGFFKVLLDNGQIAYTRDGSFKRDSEGKLVTSNGNAIDPEVILDSTAVAFSVASDGTVSIQRTDGTSEDVGQIQLAVFPNPAGLTPIGQNLFIPSQSSGTATDGNPGDDGFGTLNQGMLETSNVQIVEELTNLIVAQRAYETNSKAVQTADDMLSIANQLRR